MIKPVEITCPVCGKKSELFLTINPSVIIINCPVCMAPLLHSNNKVKLLTKREHSILSSAVEDKSLNKMLEKEIMENKFPEYSNDFVPDEPLYYSGEHINDYLTERRIITYDDIINLKIALETSKDVLEFIKQL